LANDRASGLIAVAAATVAAAGLASTLPAAAQAPSKLPLSEIPRTASGRPDLSGIWQSFTTANWNILAHSSEPGPHAEIMGAWGAGRGGQSIVEGNELPYQPWAAAQQKKNFENRMLVNVTNDSARFETGDRELQCYRAGVPRANYMPFPFQIVQTPDEFVIVYEYKGVYRSIPMDSEQTAPAGTWMGVSNGHWEDDTLVVDVTGFNGYTWLDRAGNFHSDALHVVERWTPISPYHMKYEATIDDPKVFTRPWSMSFTLYKNVEPDAQLIEFNCVPFVEELMYAPLGLMGK
jgi:hypothetical protein